MKRIGYNILGCLAALTLVASAAHAQSINPNQVHFHLRIFNDCPPSTVTADNSGYPASIFIDDSTLPCSGFANLHVWQFSEDGGATAAQFGNTSDFSFTATVVLDGLDTNGGETGINIAPWFDETTGRINCRVPDGEIAAFGGRMPFKSWTVDNGLHYVLGTPITLTMTYHHNGLSAVSPATVFMNVNYLGNDYPFGPTNLDEGNVSEGLVHGLYGILNPATVGGHFQPRLDPGNFASHLRATWTNIQYVNYVGTTPTEKTSWGKLKSLYR